MLYIEY